MGARACVHDEPASNLLAVTGVPCEYRKRKEVWRHACWQPLAVYDGAVLSRYVYRTCI